MTAFVGEASRGPVEEPLLLTSPAGFVEAFGEMGPAGPLGPAVADFFRQGGSVAVVVRSSGPALGTALDALRRAVAVNLLVVPGDPPPEAVTAAIAFAEERRAILLRDPPAAWTTVDGAVAGAGSDSFARSPNAAVYFPRIHRPGPLRGPAGAVAGVMARSDVTRGVWKAPAGTEAGLEGVEALDVAVDDGATGRLNQLGVCCLRSFAGTGPVVWGARTTAAAGSEWKYVPVRRMALFLEESLQRGLRWAVFEPKDDRLWDRVRAEAGTFLDDLFRRGAFLGSRPSDAYFVRCDRTTTTQADVDAGVVQVVVGFAPLKPAEFVVLTVRLLAGA